LAVLLAADVASVAVDGAAILVSIAAVTSRPAWTPALT
jgi:hypothetical protein